MVNTQMHAGMDWVSGTLHGFGAAAWVDIRPIGWNTDTVNLAANQHNFVVSLNGQRRVVTFDDDELEDLTADPRLQILVEGDLREFLHDACAETYCPAESVFPW